jgi:hypothetical protein
VEHIANSISIVREAVGSSWSRAADFGLALDEGGNLLVTDGQQDAVRADRPDGEVADPASAFRVLSAGAVTPSFSPVA